MTTTLTFKRESISKTLNAGATVGDLASAAILSVLGAPENGRYTLNGQVVESSAILRDGDIVNVEEQPHQKAEGISATLTFKRESISKVLDYSATVGDLASAAILSVLGAPENGRYTLNGQVVESSAVLRDGDIVNVEEQPHQKAE